MKFTMDSLKELGISEEQAAKMISMQDDAEENETPIIPIKKEYTSATPISDIKKYVGGEYVELPGFTADAPFIAKLRRPSMLSLVKSGKIPNTLLAQAQALFADGTNSFNDDDLPFNELMQVVDILCTAALVEPSAKELKDNDIDLTDEQMLAIFSYTQRGIKAVEQFR